MANKKKEVFRPGPMTEGKRNIIQGLLQEYDIQSAADIQEALKDLLGGTIKEMIHSIIRYYPFFIEICCSALILGLFNPYQTFDDRLS